MRGTAGDTGPGGPWPGGLRDLRSAWPPRPPSPHGRWSRSPAQHTGDGLRASGCFRGTGARMRLGAPLPGHLWQRRGAPVRGHPCSRAQRLPEKELKLTLSVAGRRPVPVPVPVPGEAALLPPWAGTRAPQRPAEPRPRQGGPARLPGLPQTGLLTHSPVWALSPLLSPRRPHPEVLGPLQVSRAGSPPPHPRPGRQPDALFAGGRASPSATSWGAGGSGALCSE